jgi:hypothetical protein
MLACRYGLIAVDLEPLKPEEVVAVGRFALVEVEAESAERASLGDDHSLRVGLRNDHLGRDGERLVLVRHDGVLRQPTHAAEQDLRVPFHELGSAGEVGVEALRTTVVQRQHVELRRLDEEQPLELVQPFRLLVREVLRLCPVVWAVELPHVVVE